MRAPLFSLVHALRHFGRDLGATLELTGTLLVLGIRRLLGRTGHPRGGWDNGECIPVPVPVRPRTPLTDRGAWPRD